MFIVIALFISLLELLVYLVLLVFLPHPPSRDSPIKVNYTLTKKYYNYFSNNNVINDLVNNK